VTASIRVLVVDDSALVRQILTRALSDDARIEIVGTARNGVEALEKAGALSPDVITLDVEMPQLDGIQVLRHLKKHSDARVVMLSSVDNAATVFTALSLGAIDFVQKPSAGIAISIAELSTELGHKICTAARVSPERAAAIARGRRDSIAEGPHAGPVYRPAVPSREPGVSICVGIAASTGGPPALETVFSGLSANLPAAYVVVQHLPEGFSASLARRLSSRTDISFVKAESAMELESGCGYVAPYGSHLVVISDGAGIHRFSLLDTPSVHGVRPAADPTLASLAEQFGAGSVGVVLTGMGSDGAAGCSAIALAGGEVIVQDEETSIVWGMPHATQLAASPNRAYPIAAISDRVRRAIRDRGGR